ncbi:MAG TPA: NAD-glutamate dehydrogenase domain-containing protein, partial [Ilumatobacteraceae bacterium]
GAWESVRRHARAIGKDADKDELTIVGIGDMSGDVFGNGLLQSAHVKLIAAFDHRHIFIDPDPDPAVSYVERRRLFELPRSSWANYDTSLLSTGGAVFPRTLKSISLSAEACKQLGTDKTTFTPNELMSAILRAPVDVLWNGGIGTYVKASTESHADVGDRANDGLRVNGTDLRCRIVGEGGNLGLTQRGRIEFALGGGLVNTDAIDNSAGVDCSDHEVNIKILLGAVMAEGKITIEERNEILHSMTKEVGEQVLDDNRSQTLTLAIARRQALPMANVHARYLHVLEAEGWLNRAFESLPTDKQIADRQSAGFGLTTPEFAVVLAYTKTVNMSEMVRTEFPDNPYLEPDLVRYFPSVLQQRYRPEILRHRLRREITATQVANQMVNLSGISFDNRMTEDTGAGVVDVMRVWVAARDIFDFQALWDQLEALPTEVKLDTQLEMFLEARRMVERGALWLLRHRRPPLEIATVVAEFRPGIAELSTTLDSHLRGRMRDQLFANEAARLAARVPEGVAQRSVAWPLMHTAFDIIDLARRQGVTVSETAGAYWDVFDTLDLGWLWDAVGMLPRNDRWQTQARSALRDDLMGALADLADDALHVGGAKQWAAANERVMARAMAMFSEIRRAAAYDLTALTVALRQLHNIVLTTHRPAVQ